MLSALTHTSRFIPQPAIFFWSVTACILLPWIIACKVEMLLIWIINPYGKSGDLLSDRRRTVPILACEKLCFLSDSWFPRVSWQNSDRKTTVFVIGKGYHYTACQGNEKCRVNRRYSPQDSSCCFHFIACLLVKSPTGGIMKPCQIILLQKTGDVEARLP